MIYSLRVDIMNKCTGCGAILQTSDSSKIGYAVSESHSLCNRCFRIQNYNEYQKIEKTNEEFLPILKQINDTKSLVVLVVDILNINKNLKTITSKLSNDILLVLTKRDVLPYSLKDEKLLSYDYGIQYIDSIMISSNKNYGLDELYQKINRYKKDKKVYVVGYSNVGKSTLINKMIYHYSNESTTITTSMLPSTTLDMLEVKIDDDLILVDTPGIIEDGNIINYVDSSLLKKIICKKEIKPITYQIKQKQTIMIDDVGYIECENQNNLTFYMSNLLKIERKFKNLNNSVLKEHIVRVKDHQDIVILGLGFIKTTHADTFKIYLLDGVDIYTRTSLI